MKALTAAAGRVRIIPGDCRETLASLSAGSINCIVTSPPYFGLRDYGMPDQIGLEPTPAEFVAALVAVFREARRVLREDGTVWLNLGDSYAAARGGTHQPAETLAGGSGGKTEQGERVNRGRADGYNPTRNAHGIGLKHKDLIGIPWRVAFALQEDGWYLRQDIIWAKPNPMPESVRDRCTKAHEYVFLLSKSPRYFYDQAAIAEAARYPGDNRAERTDTRKAVDPFCADGGSRSRTGNPTGATVNRRSVWTVSTQPYDGAHFATMPPALAEPCILAGCPKGGTVLDPFGGAGTTGLVAARHGRNAILCELNPDYARLARDRIAAEWREPPMEAPKADVGPLFDLPTPEQPKQETFL